MKRAPNGNGRSLGGRIQVEALSNIDTNGAIAQFREEREGEQYRVFFRWKHEAERLFGLFWRTGRLRHLSAFIVHVVAMRRRPT